MGWTALVWSLKLLGTGLNVLGSFKALKTRPKRGSSSQRAVGQAGPSKSLSTADRARRRALKSQLITWTSWICVLQLERFADRVGLVVPLYDELKLILLLGLILLRQPVSLLIFENIISPVLSPYESPLDAMGYALEQLLGLLLFAALWPARRLWQWWRPSQEPDVPSILAGLREPNRPSLARDLANTIESSSSTSRKPRAQPPSAPVSDKQPRKAPAKLVNALAFSTSTARPASRLAKPTSAASRLTEPSSTRSGGRASAANLGGTAKSSSLYPDLPLLPRSIQAGVAHSHALSVSTQDRARQEAETASILAALPSAPNSKLVTPVLSSAAAKHSPERERVTLPIPPPPSLLENPAHAPEPDSALAPQPKRALPLSHAILDTPIPPGSFFGARQPPLRPTPPRSKMLVDSPQTAPQPEPQPEPEPRAAELAKTASGTSITSPTSGTATPRQKALSAIADLSPDLDGKGGSLLGVSRTSLTASPLVVRRTRNITQDNGEDSARSTLPKKKTAGSKSTSAPFRPTTKTGAAKRKAPPSTAADTDSLADESDGPVPAPSLRASRSNRKVNASAASAADPVLGLPRSRSRATKLAVPTAANEDHSGDSSEAMLLPAPKRKKKTAPAAAGKKDAKASETPVAPVRKARRVLVASQSVGVSDDEIDGVPVVVAGRRSARK